MYIYIERERKQATQKQKQTKQIQALSQERPIIQNKLVFLFLLSFGRNYTPTFAKFGEQIQKHISEKTVSIPSLGISSLINSRSMPSHEGGLVTF